MADHVASLSLNTFTGTPVKVGDQKAKLKRRLKQRLISKKNFLRAKGFTSRRRPTQATNEIQGQHNSTRQNAKPAGPSKPGTSLAKLAVPNAKPVVPITRKPAVPIRKPAVPVTKSAVPVTKPTVPATKPTVPATKPAVPIRKPPREKPIALPTPTVKPVVLKKSAVKKPKKQNVPLKQQETPVPTWNKGKLVLSSIFTSDNCIPSQNEYANFASDNVAQNEEEVFSSESFDVFHLHPHLVSNLSKLGYTQTTTVQKKSVQHLLDGKDMMIRSQTGSGKTLCYVIPVLQTLQAMEPKISRAEGPHCVVIVPTRELALQTLIVFEQLTNTFTWIVPGSIVGGENRKSEKARLRKGLNVVIATPGRFLDHMKSTKCLKFDNVKWLVLDEADRLLDMGYEKDVSEIIGRLRNSFRPTEHQTILLSATLTTAVKKLAGLSLKDPVNVNIENEDEKSVVTDVSNEEKASENKFVIPSTLTQYYVVVPPKLRLLSLTAFMLSKCKYEGKCKMIVFLSCCDSVDFITGLLSHIPGQFNGVKGVQTTQRQSINLPVYRLHGNLNQQERKSVYEKFVKCDCGILFSTDVAARGLDLKRIDWIIQYDTAGTPSDYIHRIGRTARIGCQGNALLFLMPSEVEYVKILNSHGLQINHMAVQEVLNILHHHVQSSTISLSKKQVVMSAEEALSAIQNAYENTVRNDARLQLLAKKGFMSYIRSYATFPAHLKHIFHVKNLHLGHLAKSFALQEKPKNISKSSNLQKPGRAGVKRRSGDQPGVRSRKMTGSNHTELGPAKRMRPQNSKQTHFNLHSEFSSGF